MRMQSIGSTTEFTEQMFTVGWIVECCTMHNEVLTGEVVSFDYETKLLVLKSAASNGTGNASNIICINLDWCSDIKIIKEAAPTIPSSDNAGTGLPTATTPTTTTNINNNNVIQQNHNHHSSSNCADNTKLPVIDIDKVEKRATNATHERRQLINAFKSGAGTEGVLLYISLIKTLGESVSFDSDSIIIKNSVRISPPYRPNSVAAIRSNTTKGPDDSVLFVKQLVEKYWQNKDSNDLTDNGNIAGGGGPGGDSGAVNVGSGVVPAPISTTTGLPPNQSPVLKRNTTAASVVAGGGGLSKQQQQQTAPPPPPTSVPNNNSTNNSNTSSSLSSSLPVTNNNTNPNPSNYSKVVAASSNVPQRDHHPQHQHHHPQSQQQQQHHHHQNHPNDSATNTNKTKRSQQTNQQQQQHHSQQSSHQRNVEISHSKK